MRNARLFRPAGGPLLAGLMACCQRCTLPLVRIASMVIVAALAAAAGCSKAPVVIIKNQSSLTLSNIVVTGAGFTNHIPSIRGGAEHRLTVQSTADSGIRLVFDAGGQHVDSGSQGYFEARGGYRVTAIVDTNLGVSVTSELRRF